MIAHFRKIALAVALGASALAVAAPAEAQRYGNYRSRDNGGTAVLAGVAGLAIGAALASRADNRDDSYYYDQGYDGPIVYYPQVYDGYRDGGYPGYNYYRGYSGGGYNGYYRGGGYDRRRGHDGRGDHRGGYGRGGRNGGHR